MQSLWRGNCEFPFAKKSTFQKMIIAKFEIPEILGAFLWQFSIFHIMVVFHELHGKYWATQKMPDWGGIKKRETWALLFFYELTFLTIRISQISSVWKKTRTMRGEAQNSPSWVPTLANIIAPPRPRWITKKWAKIFPQVLPKITSVCDRFLTNISDAIQRGRGGQNLL